MGHYYNDHHLVEDIVSRAASDEIDAEDALVASIARLQDDTLFVNPESLYTVQNQSGHQLDLENQQIYQPNQQRMSSFDQRLPASSPHPLYRQQDLALYSSGEHSAQHGLQQWPGDLDGRLQTTSHTNSFGNSLHDWSQGTIDRQTVDPRSLSGRGHSLSDFNIGVHEQQHHTGFGSRRSALFNDTQGELLQLGSHLSSQREPFHAHAAQVDSAMSLGPQYGSTLSGNQQFMANGFAHPTSDQTIHLPGVNQPQYIRTRSAQSALAQDQYRNRLIAHLSQMRPQRPAMFQNGVDDPDNIESYQLPQDVNQAPGTPSEADSSAQSSSVPSSTGPQPSQASNPGLKRRYTPEELQIITTMMTAGATPEQIGQRLGRNPNSILLKWGRMQGRYADPHAAAKRRRGNRHSQA